MIEAHLIQILMVQTCLLLAAFSAFALHGSWLWWNRKLTTPHMARARATIASSLASPSADTPNLSLPPTLSTRLRIRLLVDLARNLDGVGREQLSRLASDLGLVTRAERRCASAFWWRRLEGARLLTLFRAGHGIMPQLLRDPHPLVRAQAAEWVADHPTLPGIANLLQMLGEEQSVSRFSVEDSLSRMGRIVVEPLARHLATNSGPPVAAALRVASRIPDQRFLLPATMRCQDPDPTVRALAAQLVGSLGGSKSVGTLTDLLRDGDADVRAAAARSLGRLHHWPAAPALVPLLRDRHWIVRREAGLALRALGAPGILFLRRCFSDADAFAADMARQVLDLPDMSDRAMAI